MTDTGTCTINQRRCALLQRQSKFIVVAKCIKEVNEQFARPLMSKLLGASAD